MTSERLDVRLDPERQRRLREVAATYHTSVSDAVRHLIDDAYEDSVRERRRQAARDLGSMAIEDVPDPETLARQLEEAHEPGGVH